MLSWIQGAAILGHRTSDVKRLRHWYMHVGTSYVSPWVSCTTRIAYVTVTVMREASATVYPVVLL